MKDDTMLKEGEQRGGMAPKQKHPKSSGGVVKGMLIGLVIIGIIYALGHADLYAPWMKKPFGELETIDALALIGLTVLIFR